MDKGLSNGQVENNIVDNGKITNFMAKENGGSQMDQREKGHLRTT